MLGLGHGTENLWVKTRYSYFHGPEGRTPVDFEKMPKLIPIVQLLNQILEHGVGHYPQLNSFSFPHQ